MVVSINGSTPKWSVYRGKAYENWWFGGTPILGKPHISYITDITWKRSSAQLEPKEHLCGARSENWQMGIPHFQTRPSRANLGIHPWVSHPSSDKSLKWNKKRVVLKLLTQTPVTGNISLSSQKKGQHGDFTSICFQNIFQKRKKTWFDLGVRNAMRKPPADRSPSCSLATWP